MATRRLLRPQLIRAGRRLRLLRSHLRRVTSEELVRSAAMTRGRLDYADAEIFIQLSSREEFHRLHSCRKEPWTVRWLERSLSPGEVLFDVGANIGAYTLLAAAIEPGARVVAFEPLPGNLAALAANVELNAVGDRVTIVPLALGEQPGRGDADEDATTPGASPPLSIGDGGLLVDRLDDVVTRWELPRPTLIKLDADGHEAAIVAGAEATLSHPGLRSIMAELDPRGEVRLSEALAGHGFELAERAEGVDRPAGTPSYGLFLRR